MSNNTRVNNPAGRDPANQEYNILLIKALDKMAKRLRDIDESLMTIATKLDVIAYGDEEDDISVDEETS